MNNLYLGGAGLVGAILFFLYRWGLGKAVEVTMQHTQDADKSLQQQQTENEARLAKINRDLASLYEEREKLQNEHKTDEEKARSWNESH